MGVNFPYSKTQYRPGKTTNNEVNSQILILERIVSVFPVPYYWGWAIFSGIIFLVVSAIIFHFENSFLYILSILILSVIMAQQAVIIIWAHKKMEVIKEYLLDIIDLPEDKILKWYENQVKIIFNEKRMLISGVV